jgi:hypothetical protein
MSPLHVSEGASLSTDGAAAVAEATSTWTTPPDLIFAFTSPVRPAADVARALASRYPSAQIIGCTTAGEHLSGAHSNGGLVLSGLRSPQLRWASGLVEDLAHVGEPGVRAVVDQLFRDLGVDRESFDPRRFFALCFLDGLAGREEAVTPLIADALDGIALIGGSAGDDLQFRRTEVICGGRAVTDAAVVVLCETALPFSILKHQHFHTTTHKLAITRADAAARRVYEIDGEPAALAYARALGIARADLTAAVAFQHPLTFRYQHQLYVRSVREIHDDDSISLYCAIDEGMVVDIGGHEDLVPALATDLAAVSAAAPAAFLFGSNCILRALETGQAGHHAEVGALFATAARHMVGFDTYGEQLHGLHINQTLVALALHDVPEAA